MTGIREEIEGRIAVLENQIAYYRRAMVQAQADLAEDADTIAGLEGTRNHWLKVLDKIEPEAEGTDR